MNWKKRFICIVTVLSLVCLMLTGCGAKHKLSGKYESESGRYEVKFELDGDCTWYQDGMFFEGNYYWDKDDEVYYLDIKGSGFYSNTTFEAEPDGNDLIVTGGVVRGEVFSK